MIEGSIDWGNGCIYLEASAGAPVLAALRVEGEELAGEDARQRRLLVGTVVHAGRSLAAANMNRARCGQVETKRIKDKIEHYSQSFLIVVQRISASRSLCFVVAVSTSSEDLLGQ